MRLAFAFALVLAAAAAPRQGCGNGAGGVVAYDACAEKACGDACQQCSPGDPTCVETAVVKACDPFGRCVPLTDGLCITADGSCTGKICGDECAIDPPCRSATPPCMMPTVIGHCANDTECVAGPPPPCPPGTGPCAGKSCGDPCDRCGGMCMNPVATACDAAGACVPVPVACPP